VTTAMSHPPVTAPALSPRLGPFLLAVRDSKQATAGREPIPTKNIEPRVKET
jgi:hypothetical protein